MHREPTWVTGPLGLLLIISAGACSGGNAMSPERPAMVSEAWAGTITLTNKNVTSSFETGGPVSVTISQSDASATGEFRATDVSGAFAGRDNRRRSGWNPDAARDRRL
jgi:hypothetical protein